MRIKKASNCSSIPFHIFYSSHTAIVCHLTDTIAAFHLWALTFLLPIWLSTFIVLSFQILSMSHAFQAQFRLCPFIKQSEIYRKKQCFSLLTSNSSIFLSCSQNLLKHMKASVNKHITDRNIKSRQEANCYVYE